MTILNGTSTVLQVNSSGAEDTTAPVLQTVATSVDGLTVTLTYNESLDTGSTPATGDFSFSPSKTISNVNVTGSTVVLTVSVAFANGDTITLDYTAASNPIQDSAGNDAANLSGQSVTNNVPVASWAPTDLGSNLLLWLDASDVTVDGSNNVTAWADKGTNSETVTVVGSPDWDGSGKITGPDTAQDSFVIADDTNFSGVSTGLIAFVAYPQSADSRIVNYTQDGSSTVYVNFGISSSNVVRFRPRNAGGTSGTYTGTTTLNDGDVVIFANEGGNIKCYINNVEETLSGTTDSWFNTATNADTIKIGGPIVNSTSGGATDPFETKDIIITDLYDSTTRGEINDYLAAL